MARTSRVWGVLVAGFLLLGPLASMTWASTGAVVGNAVTELVVPPLWYVAPIGSVLALLFAWVFYRSLMRADEGTPVMKGIAQDVREGAMAYLMRQYKVLVVFFAVVCGILVWMSFGLGVQHSLVPFAFLTGGFFSGLCGFLGMKTATNASARTTQACRDEQNGLNAGLTIAFRSGAVMGMVVVGFALLDICMWFLLLKTGVLESLVGPMSLEEITVVMLTFGMGASSQALFARVGGGIYTKAADVGADLVGKVEAGIPEDDPRNPATIADNVGDNVGDVAGMGADLYESYAGSILASAALGVAAVAGLFHVGKLPPVDGVNAGEALKLHWQLRFLALPMVLAGIGILVSIAGVFLVRTKEGASFKDLLRALSLPIWITSVVIAGAAFGAVYWLFDGQFTGVALSVVVGLFAGVWIGNRTEYYTSYDFEPTQGVSKQSEYGPATVIIDGIAVGMWSTAWPVITIVGAIVLSFGFAGGFGGSAALGLYGVALAAVGMLSTLGYTLATDAYGPIADNAGGNAEMAGLEPAVRQRTDALDSLGNTTAATGKGFAIGSAALTALALIAAYIEEVRIGLVRAWEAAGHAGPAMLGGGAGAIPVETATLADFMAYYHVTLMNPIVLCGLFIGAMLAFSFCAMTMKAVGRAAGNMVAEVRRQFRDIPGIMEYAPDDTSDANRARRPEYAKCVAIATKGAQKEMILPSLMALAVPIATGLVFGVAGVVGLLAGGLATGFVLAIMMANAGGAWDNAKKWIEQREPLTAGDVFATDAKAKARVATAEAALGIDLARKYRHSDPAREIEGHGKLGDIWTDKKIDDKKRGALLREHPEEWDNRPDRVIDGKHSDAHSAGIIGDTVGDPFKDTSGPSLNILIKLMSMVAVVFAGLTATVGSDSLAAWTSVLADGHRLGVALGWVGGIIVLIAALVFALKRLRAQPSADTSANA